MCFHNQIRIVNAPFNPFPRLRNIAGNTTQKLDVS
ncbi:hypothetical protein HY29_14640 [Hyphomonas beringensis]|uniref:Uncharacterized protein n=1 Tax=Hyphomonas beringensis TaxID=1280946 RepID=A0A062UE34_9PROT|nr:hypothetical protein HY29_14640 [Hyphomonas beringensis]